MAYQSNCNLPNPSGFKAWATSQQIRDEGIRAARCGWNAGIKGVAFSSASLDHAAAYDAQGKRRPGSDHAFRIGWEAGYHRYELAEKKRTGGKSKAAQAPSKSKAADDARYRKENERYRKEAARIEKERMAKEIANAAKGGIYAIAAVDDRAGLGFASDSEIGNRLRRVSEDDVAAVGGWRAAVKLYNAERKRLRTSRQAERKIAMGRMA